MPLPRGSVQAAYPGTCPACCNDVALALTAVVPMARQRQEFAFSAMDVVLDGVRVKQRLRGEQPAVAVLATVRALELIRDLGFFDREIAVAIEVALAAPQATYPPADGDAYYARR